MYFIFHCCNNKDKNNEKNRTTFMKIITKSLVFKLNIISILYSFLRTELKIISHN